MRKVFIQPKSALTLLWLAISIPTADIMAALGDVDPSFQPGSGINGFTISSVVVQPDKKVLIVGDFTTQSPSRTGKFMRQQDGSVFVEGSTLIRDLNRKMGLHFSLEGAKTLNGMIQDHLQDIPESGTSLKINGYPIEIIQIQDRVVKVARIVIAPSTRVVN